jgi:ATP-dependent Lon protease
MEDIPEEVRTQLTFHCVETLDEVFAVALLPATQPVNTPKTEMEEAEEAAAKVA